MSFTMILTIRILSQELKYSTLLIILGRPPCPPDLYIQRDYSGAKKQQTCDPPTRICLHLRLLQISSRPRQWRLKISAVPSVAIVKCSHTSGVVFMCRHKYVDRICESTKRFQTARACSRGAVVFFLISPCARNLGLK